MMNLRKQLKQPLKVIPKWFPILVTLLAFIGFGDATYLTIEHFQNKIPPCAIGGCETVLTSAYATIFGIPVSILGVLFYLSILVLGFMYVDSKKERYIRGICMLSILGLLASLYFASLMIFVLTALCLYCAVSGVTSLTIFIASFYVLLINSKNNQQNA